MEDHKSRTIKMKSFLLLSLSLMTGCEAWSKMRGCREGWVEFTCKYPNPNEIYQYIEVERPGGIKVRSTLKDVWEIKNSVSLYHDTKSKQLRVAIKQCECIDSGRYKCEFKGPQSSDEEVLRVHVEKDGCQGKFVQTAYTTAKTTIKCDYPGNKDKTSVKFLCKENNVTCEDILSTNSSLKSNRTFSLTETDSGFKVSITDVSSHDAGVYWCGVDKEKYRAGLKRIQLEIKNITTLRRSPATGQNLTYLCEYPNGTPIRKFICKGEDPSVCTTLASTSRTNNGRFFLRENRWRRNLTVTVRQITAEDTGTYWCGAVSTNRRHSNPFFHRLVMTVVTPTEPAVPSATFLPSVTEPTVTSKDCLDNQPAWATAVSLSLKVLLLLMLTSVVCTHFDVCKNLRRCTKRQRWNQVYEEIQEQTQKPIRTHAALGLHH